MIATAPRQSTDELIDQADIPFGDLDRSLADLEWSNRWLGGRSALFSHLVPVVEQCDSFLDVGCGSGDMLRAVAERRAGLRLVGLDLNPAVVDIARLRGGGRSDIDYVLGRAMALPFADNSFDVVFSSTFIHHLTEIELVESLREAARVARRRVVMADLVRSCLGWLGVWLVGRVAYGKLSRYDGPVSFRRAYLPDELAEFAGLAGLSGARIQRHRFYRMVLVYDKEET
jgi:SAM-dependent methyltransferase